MYDPEIADGFDMEAKIHQYSQEWVGSLNRDDIMSLSIFHAFLTYRLHFSKGDSAKMISELLGYSDRTISEWRTDFMENECSFPEGSYQRSGVLWQNEELNKKAREFVKANAIVQQGIKYQKVIII